MRTLYTYVIVHDVDRTAMHFKVHAGKIRNGNSHAAERALSVSSPVRGREAGQGRGEHPRGPDRIRATEEKCVRPLERV